MPAGRHLRVWASRHVVLGRASLRKLAGREGLVPVEVDVHYASGKTGKAIRYKTPEDAQRMIDEGKATAVKEREPGLQGTDDDLAKLSRADRVKEVFGLNENQISGLRNRLRLDMAKLGKPSDQLLQRLGAETLEEAQEKFVKAGIGEVKFGPPKEKPPVGEQPPVGDKSKPEMVKPGVLTFQEDEARRLRGVGEENYDQKLVDAPARRALMAGGLDLPELPEMISVDASALANEDYGQKDAATNHSYTHAEGMDPVGLKKVQRMFEHPVFVKNVQRACAGVVNTVNAADAPGVQQFIVDPLVGTAKAKPGFESRGGYYNRDGKVIATDSLHGAMLANLLRNKSVASSREMYAFTTLLHESLHAASNNDRIYEGVYTKGEAGEGADIHDRRPGVAMEEATTEILTHAYKHQFAKTIGVTLVTPHDTREFGDWQVTRVADGSHVLEPAAPIGYKTFCRGFANVVLYAEGMEPTDYTGFSGPRSPKEVGQVEEGLAYRGPEREAAYHRMVGTVNKYALACKRRGQTGNGGDQRYGLLVEKILLKHGVTEEALYKDSLAYTRRNYGARDAKAMAADPVNQTTWQRRAAQDVEHKRFRISAIVEDFVNGKGIFDKGNQSRHLLDQAIKETLKPALTTALTTHADLEDPAKFKPKPYNMEWDAATGKLQPKGKKGQAT